MSFDEFQEVNALRCATKFPSCDDWTLNDWAVAISGEVGELCNILKKNRRGDRAYSLEGAHGSATRREILKELADVITYADLAAQVGMESRSGTFGDYLSLLRTTGLVTTDGGTARANAEVLFL